MQETKAVKYIEVKWNKARFCSKGKGLSLARRPETLPCFVVPFVTSLPSVCASFLNRRVIRFRSTARLCFVRLLPGPLFSPTPAWNNFIKGFDLSPDWIPCTRYILSRTTDDGVKQKEDKIWQTSEKREQRSRDFERIKDVDLLKLGKNCSSTFEVAVCKTTILFKRATFSEGISREI